MFHPTKTTHSDRDIAETLPAVCFPRLHRFAERMEWDGYWPGWFWFWLVRRLDAANKYRFEHLGDGE